MLELVQASKGGALLLFTSLTAMRRAYDVIAPVVEWNCYMQGQMEVPVLAQKFKEDHDSILFATRSFMEGIDVQGDSLRLVVLDKLVFASPGEPVNEALHEVIESRGGNGFKEIDLPEMMLILEQAAGRLIRTVTDRGVFALLDPRIWTKFYGSKVRGVLPPFTQVDSLGAVQEFFGAS
jgi:ATP-dependent DNA helicase DinG